MDQIKSAVILRGQARTWNHIAENNIRALAQYLGDVDWFVVLSETSTTDEKSIRKAFEGYNLISVQILKDDDYALYKGLTDPMKWKKFPTSYWRQAWFEYVGNLSKRQYELETGIRYQRVCCARLDTWFFSEKGVENDLSRLSNFSIIGTAPGNDKEDLTGADFTWVSGAAAANVMAMRYYDTEFTDSISTQAVHPGDLNSLQYYILKNCLLVDSHLRVLSQVMVRPNQIPSLPLDIEIAKINNFYIKDREQWQFANTEERIAFCEKYGIDPQDYFLIDDFTKKT